MHEIETNSGAENSNDALSPPTRLRSLLMISFVTVMIVVMGLVTAGYLVANTGGSPAAGSTILPASTSLDCNSAGNPAPSSLYINLAEPTTNLAAGGSLALTMEFAVVNYSASDKGITLYFPTQDFTFPLAPTGNYTATITPEDLTIAGPGWTNGANTNRTVVPAGGLNFVQGGKVRLSTQKIAIMANTPYGSLTMMFHWEWKMTEPNGTVSQSGWSPTTAKWGGGVVLPSVFFPAQYIQFLSGAGNGQSVTIGTTYSATIGGPVGGHYYFLEMENGAGSVVQSQGTTLPANATSGNVTIPVLNYDHYLPPGLYLVHIHDICGAILYNKEIKAVFAPSVTVTFYLSPSFCGPMTFNGTSFASGSTGTFAPSTTPYVFTVPHCTGYAFSNWSDTGGLHISSSDHLMVSYYGTFTIEYKPT
jgi:hypothetical protein